jgi:WD40 repeat protein
MSAVYRATDPNLRRMVAIKLIHTHLSVNPDFIHRFKEEAAAVARLRHPNIVQVHDFNIDGETYYMVMEYLIGETLQARLKRLNAENRPMPFTEVTQISQQLSEAVGYAHNHELIHRDIKPANIMLDLNGQAILMDFGIVKIVGGEYHTATGATIGTAMYMSPEQIRSEKADERSDIYSLGVTLYEMISGRTPYKADSVLTLMMKVLNDPLPDLAKIREGIPESLLAAVNKALEKDKKDRFQTMDEMIAALQRTQEHVAGITQAVTIIDDVQHGSTSAEDSPAEAVAATEHAETELEGTVPLQAEKTVMESPERDNLEQQQKAAAALTVKDQAVEPAPVRQQAAKSGLRDSIRQNYRKIIAIAASLLLLGAAAAVGYIYIASQREPELQLDPIKSPQVEINAETAQFVVNLGLWNSDSFIEELAFSPDGQIIGASNNRDLMQFSKYQYYGSLWEVEKGSLQNYLLGQTQWMYGAAFSPNGQLFATSSDDASVYLWNVSDGSLAQSIVDSASGGVTSVDFSPNNLLLAAGTWNGTVNLWDLRDGNLLRTFLGHESSVRDVAFSPDGNLLASASEDNNIKLWQVSNGSLVNTLSGHSAQIHSLAFSPDGSQLASASEDYTIKLWQISDGSLVRNLQGHSDSVLEVAFSPDGSLLASGSNDGTLRLWRASDGELLRILREHWDSITGIDFSPDGRMLVSTASDGVMRFWGLSEAIPLETEAPAEALLTETEPPTTTPFSDTLPPEASPTPALLSAEGPWAVFSNKEGMWITNSDGSAVTNLGSAPVVAVDDLSQVVSPDGRFLAFLTATDNFYDLTLHVIELPHGQEVLNLALTSTQTEPDADAIQGDQKLEIASAISLAGNPVWSEDGLWLAFMGAQEGPTSDLYVYSLISGETTRLTDGISQGIKPTWSPDSSYIVHSGVSTLGTGAGYALDGVWAAPVDGSEVNTLYQPESEDEIWMGWTGLETLLVYSWSAQCEKYDLRAVNILTDDVHPIWEGNFHSAAFDPDSGSIAVALQETSPLCESEATNGLYLIPPGEQGAVLVAAEGEVDIDPVSELFWSETREQFLIGTEGGLFAISLSGEVSRFPAPGANSPVTSPDGTRLAWRFTSLQENTGVWVAEWGSDPTQIYDQNSGWALWMDNNSLLFIGSDGLYLAQGPDYEPVLVQPGFWASGMASSFGRTP